MKGKGKEKEAINKEEDSENWCFVCKDGGELRLCDYKQCLKSYHPDCVGKDDSFLESEKKWDCAWHTCSYCRRSSYLHCYTCTNSVCRQCLPDADILQIKRKYGLCKPCLKLALLIEEEQDYDSEGEKVDFTDRETCEGLFMEYYAIIKKDEGFEVGDIYAAKERVKVKKNHQPESDLEDFDEEEQISDYDESEDEKKRRKSRKRSKGQKSAKQTPTKSNKKEFIGWASRSLIDFLHSIGKSTSEKLSQQYVTTIVNEYVKENKLIHPGRKKMIMCDARLQSLFRKKIINKRKVHDLLEDHFAENHDESEEDELVYDSEESNAETLSAYKRPRKLDVEKNSPKKDLKLNVPQSRFAAIVIENVKLVYLKRSVLKELLKQPESFEEKVIGCFARVKSDPNDYRSRKSHQLMQVTGVKTVPIDENNTETILLFSAMPKEMRLSLLSDEDISEEDCEDLREKVLAGEVERPTVEDLQQKAKVLHKDITSHWIRKELALLQNLIDQANEKGWRRELFEYLDRRKKLQSPSERLRLLEDVPRVIPDVYEDDSDSGGIKCDDGSPESIPPCNSSVPFEGKQEKEVPEEITPRGHASPSETKQPSSEKSASKVPQCGDMPDSKLKLKLANSNTCGKHVKWKGHAGSKTVVIDILSDDEEEDDNNDKKPNDDVTILKTDDDLENEMWCVRGSNGKKSKSSLRVLKRWSEKTRHASTFKVWKENQSEEDAIPLPEAIRIALPRK